MKSALLFKFPSLIFRNFEHNVTTRARAEYIEQSIRKWSKKALRCLKNY